MTIPVVFVGLGPIGRLCAEIALERTGLEIMGAVDIDPDLVGRDLGAVLGGEAKGVIIRNDIASALSEAADGVVVLTTSSSMSESARQVKACLESGWSVVSTCEEMGYPWRTQPELSREIDGWAKSAGRAVLATGVNPGFAMDALPAFISGVTRRVESVVVERCQDASQRRLPFQKKIGAGLGLEAFQRLVNEGRIRHVGFKESVHLIAAAWGIELTKVEELVRPVMAVRPLKSRFMEVRPGQVAGVDQIAQGFVDQDAVITLNLQAWFGHPDPRERILIQGDPPLEVVIPGGVFGDTATCAMTVNAIPRVKAAPPGLRTMLDTAFPTGCYWNGPDLG